MKKLLLTLAIALLVPGVAFAAAKKLGTTAYSAGSGNSEIAAGGGSSSGGGAIACNPSTCTTGKKCSGNSCVNCSYAQDCGCPSGKISSGSGSCVSCPANAVCAGGNVTCNTGYYKSGSGTSTSCVACPAGCTACTSSSSCSSCKSGYYKSGTSCITCPSNATCSGGTSGFNCNTGYTSSGSSCGMNTDSLCKTYCGTTYNFDRMGGNGVGGYTPAVEWVCSDTAQCNSTNQCTTGGSNGLERWDMSTNPIPGQGGVTCQKAIAKKTCSVWDADESDSLVWNANGAKTIPAGIKCWDGYGANATITVPNGAVYEHMQTRFWQGATVNGAFSTGILKTVANTSIDANAVMTFNGKVSNVSEVWLERNPSSKIGTSVKFVGGLGGSVPSCKVYICTQHQYGCTLSTTYSCSCTTSGCTLSN